MELSQRDAAAALDLSEEAIAHMVSDEGLPAFLINGRYRFNRTDLLEWATRRGLPTAALYGADPERIPLHALLADRIHHEVPGSDLRTALAAVAERLPVPPGTDRDLIARVMAERESGGSTSVGDGIAIPHVRSPVILPVDGPAMALCFLACPVPFGEAGSVGVIWALVSPTVRSHLDILARTAAALQDRRLRSLLIARAPASEILGRLRELA